MSQIKSSASSPAASSQRLLKFQPLYAFWKFCRPHTVIGTSLSVIGLATIAHALNQFNLTWGGLLITLLACLSGNVYIVGLNQIEDIAIDAINKPHLPLAAGEFSRLQAWLLVASTGLLALLLALWQGGFLLITIGLSLLIGTAYSLPPIRLKRFSLWASLCILTVRGVIVNLGVFLHLQGGGAIPAAVWALTLFVIVFTFAIAIFKDIPDLEGDRQYNIHTFTLRLGQRKVFDLSLWVLTSCYLGMIGAGLIPLPGVNPWFLVVTHTGALAALWIQQRAVNLAEKASITRFYQFIWKLFFLEYLLFPIACLLQSPP
jgi:homogentisate phytyltransferase/homogentisate geranylgeranyltransferase